jgi:hypothetical protein
MTEAPGVLRDDWDSNYRELRDFLAVLVTTLVALSPPYYLLWTAFSGRGITALPDVLDANLGLVTVLWLWTLVILSAFGGRLVARYRAM